MKFAELLCFQLQSKCNGSDTVCIDVTTCEESGLQHIASRYVAVRSYEDKTGNNDASGYNNTGSSTPGQCSQSLLLLTVHFPLCVTKGSISRAKIIIFMNQLVVNFDSPCAQ